MLDIKFELVRAILASCLLIFLIWSPYINSSTKIKGRKLFIGGILLVLLASFLNITQHLFEWEETLFTKGNTISLEIIPSIMLVGAAFIIFGFIRFISSHKRIIENLEGVEHQLQTLSEATENNPSLIIITNKQGNIEYINPRFLEVTGYTREELIGQNPRVISTDVTPPEIYKNLWKTINAGKNWTGEFLNKKKNGDTYLARATIAPIKDKKGEIHRFVGVQEDITERRAKEEKLKTLNDTLEKNRDKLRHAHKIALIAEWEWDVEGSRKERVIEQGKAISRVLLKASKPLGFSKYSSSSEYLHPDDRDYATNHIRESLEKHIPLSFECRMRINEDDEYEWCRINGDIQSDKQKRLTKIFGTIQNIDGQKKTALALASASKQLKQTLESLPGGVAYFDENERLLFANKTLFQMYKISEDEIEKLAGTIENACHFMANRGMLGSGSPEQLALEAINRFRKKQPQTYSLKIPETNMVVEFRQQPLANGETIVLITDITKLHQITKTLVAAKEAADHANQAKSEFLSSMSHELRTPLNAILGFSQVMKNSRKNPLNEKQKQQLSHIENGGKHLLHLIDEILELAKIEAGKITLSIENIAARNLFEETLDLAKSYDQDKSITFIDYTNEVILPDLKVDFTKSKQVLLNLFSNAIKYNHDGGTVRLYCDNVRPGFLRIYISDTGQGIPQKRHGDIFQPFNRLGAERTDIEGTGIGLALTKQLVTAMKGKIGFESIDGEGSTFWVDLPISTTVSPLQEKLNTENTNHQQIIPNEKTILYVEDNPLNFDLMVDIVDEIPGLKLIGAQDAEMGLQYVIEKQPDIIIMDINLPGIDGNEAVRRLRKNEQTKHLPVIALSADAMSKSIDESKKAGFDDYLTKPVDVNQLKLALDKNLGTK
ncbi:MAG: PAS domain S-box protein [Rhodospirillales bacterium]|nr:PAS domain S-box protein [Rhodospirillales bacterium]